MANFSLNGLLTGKLLFALTALYLQKCILALPHTTRPSTIRPWIQPCTPFTTLSRPVNMTDMSGDVSQISSRLKEKTLEALYHAIYLESLMASRFHDGSIVSYLQNKSLPGFPDIPSNENNSQNKSVQYREASVTLSKVAVYLEQIHKDETEKELKEQLEQLQNENFSILCELEMCLQITGTRHSSTIYRSLIPRHVRQVGNAFKRYKRDFIVMFRYSKILQQYKKIYYS